MKDIICTGTGVAGSFLASAFGGFDAALVTLLIFMAADYISGLVVAGVFKKSTKSETGALESKAGWKGLCRKGMSLVFVLIGCRLDIAIGTTYIRDAICIALITNELISLVENAGLMGVPIPGVIKNAIEILKSKSNTENTATETEEN